VSIPLSVAQIAQQTKLSKPAIHTVLERLESRGIIRQSRSGNAHLYQIRRDNIYVEKVIEPLFALEKDTLVFMKESLVSMFGVMTYSMMIFGSFARGDYTAHSDVDVLIIAENRSAQLEIERRMIEYGSTFYHRFGHTLSPLVYTVQEAKMLPTNAPALYAELLDDGYLISGAEDWMTHE
jgi:predicted nucleotidyltransferase